jgi:hypothetical protein
MLTDVGLIRHEIEFERASLILICADVEYRWMPSPRMPSDDDPPSTRTGA